MKGLHLILYSMLLVSGSGGISAADTCPVKKIEVERLPDLNIPRAGHSVFYVNGELTVTGGHTAGFVPTATAEYFKDGKWHLMQMVYNHDFGFSAVLKNGKVLLGGGCEQPIGIGQTFTAELYDPPTHTFDGFGSMQHKRTLASALEMDSGRVVVSGNWYHDDDIEVFDGQNRFTQLKETAVGRVHPYILRTAKDDALIFGKQGSRNDTVPYVADRLKGGAVHIPFFETWHPLPVVSHRFAESFVGDESKGVYAYLISVIDSTGQVAIAKVENGDFLLLPTVCPIPMQSHGERISYIGPVVVDQKAGRGYLMGGRDDYRAAPEKPNRYYIVCIDYAQAADGKPAPLTLYYTDPIMDAPDYTPVLDADGHLMLAGGLLRNNNFTPSGAVWLLRVGTLAATTETVGFRWWLLVAGVIFVFFVLGGLLWWMRRKSKSQAPAAVQHSEPAGTDPNWSQQTNPFDALMQRISLLMDQQKIYTNTNLKVSDIASLLGVNSHYVTDCIRQKKGCSVTQFINKYRLEHAKRLLRSQQETKHYSIWLEAGFASEQSFYRIFKQYTGQTPSEWKSNS